MFPDITNPLMISEFYHTNPRFCISSPIFMHYLCVFVCITSNPYPKYPKFIPIFEKYLNSEWVLQSIDKGNIH